MASESGWTDRKKWIMGILSALIVAALITLFNRFNQPPSNGITEPSPTPTSTPVLTPSPTPTPEPPRTPTPEPSPTPDPPPTSTPEPSPTPTPPPTTGLCTRSVEGFDFHLERCGPEGDDLNCWFRVTNTRGQRSLSIFVDGTSLNDQNDDNHEVKRLIEINGNREFNILRLNLATNSSRRFGLQFAGLGEYVTSIKGLTINTRDFDVSCPAIEVK